MMSVLRACKLYLVDELLFSQRENAVQHLHKIHAAIEQDAAPINETPGKTIIFVILHGLGNLTGEICKWQHIQFAIEEIHDVSGLSLLPAQQQFQAISAFIPLDVSVDAEQAIFTFTHP